MYDVVVKSSRSLSHLLIILVIAADKHITYLWQATKIGRQKSAEYLFYDKRLILPSDNVSQQYQLIFVDYVSLYWIFCANPLLFLILSSFIFCHGSMW